MNPIHFHKYQGTGNDFILIDNREQRVKFNSSAAIESICDRRFGIGADGLILLEQSAEHDFKMIYYNADGNEGSMCGNGGRCIVAFAHQLGIVNKNTTFEAIDGVHEAIIEEVHIDHCIVSLKMNDVKNIERDNENYIMNTGSPHYVTIRNQIDFMDIYNEGKSIRNNSRFKEHGINVNFIEVLENKLKIRTYERGVEAETLSCGTGSVAAAIVFDMEKKKLTNQKVEVITKGGTLFVKLNPSATGYTNIWLIGPASEVFTGVIENNA